LTEFSTIINAIIALAIGGLSLAASYRALLTSRTPQGAVGWILFIILLPLIGTLLYLVFGYADYKRFARERRLSDAASLDEAKDDLTLPAVPSRLTAFSRIARLPATKGNDMALLIDGHATFEALHAAMRTATSRIMVQFYTIEDDTVGQAFHDILIERARAGVDVFVLHDELPFFGLPAAFKKSLRDAGVRLARTKGPTRVLGPFQLNFRNHRKLVVVDDTVGFTGGINLSKAYIGESSLGPWRDTFARFHGPVVKQLALHFISDWRWATNEDLDHPAIAAAIPKGRLNAVALAPSPAEETAAGNLFFIALAHAAQKRLWISTPYFAPDRDVLTALRFAALRGVDVKVIVPRHADHYLTHFAGMAYFDDLRAVGGEIWSYTPAFLHQKVALVDDDLASVGSINLDIRSGLLNFELTVVMEGASAAADVEAMLRTDLDNATRIDFDLDDRPVLTRMAARVARLMAPVL
jgi:cardiolipin synthase